MKINLNKMKNGLNKRMTSKYAQDVTLNGGGGADYQIKDQQVTRTKRLMLLLLR